MSTAPNDIPREFSWRRIQLADLGLLARWLDRPHVARWWCHDTSEDAVLADFGPAARGEEPSEDLLISLDGRPFGVVQRCRWGGYPGYVEEIGHLITVPPAALTLDYFIAAPDDTGQGLGAAMLSAVLDDSWTVYPDSDEVVVPVAAGNVASWRVLERLGMVRVAEGDLEPDNPIDPPLHYVYRGRRSRLI